MNATEHLLICLSEEASEISKDVSKSLRFGLEDRNILDPTGPTNRERLIQELNDMEGVRLLLIRNGVIPTNWCSPEKVEAKIKKVEQFMDYARKVGTLQ